MELLEDMVALVNRLRASVLRVLHSTGFVQNVVVVAGGTALSQGLMILASPVLTRLYTPEDFGVLGVYTAILAVLTVIALLCYEQAIPLPETNQAAANLLVLSLVILLAMTFLVGLGVLLWGEQIVRWTNTPALEPYLWLLPLAVLGGGVYRALTYWTARQQRFAILSYTKSVRMLGQVGIRVAFGVPRLGPIGLIVGHIASQFLGAFSLFKHFHLPRNTVVPQEWLALAKTYKDFPLFTVWISLINLIGIQAPAVLFAKYFTLDIAGFFSQTMMVMGLPAGLIGQAVAQVFYPKVARLDGETLVTRRFIDQVATSLFVLSFLVFSVAALHGADLFAWAFGDRWKIAGRYAQYLAPWFMISFVSSPLSSFVLAKGKQRGSFLFSCCLNVSRLGAIWLGSQYASPDLSVVLFSVVNALSYLAYIAWILRLAGSSLLTCLSRIKVFVLGGVLLVTGLFSLKPLLAPLASLIISVGSLGLFGLWFGLKDRRGTVGE